MALHCHLGAGESQWKQSIPGASSASFLLSTQNPKLATLNFRRVAIRNRKEEKKAP
jgi:hypothetical protein